MLVYGLDRVEDSHRRIDECILIGSCRINRLLFVDDLVLFASSQQGLQHELVRDRFAATCHQERMKITVALKRPRSYVYTEVFTTWHFAKKCTAVKFVKSWTSSQFSEWRDLSYDGSVTWPDYPRKDQRGKFCYYTHGKVVLRSIKDQVARLHLRPFLVPFWCEASSTTSGINENREVFRVLRLLSTRLSPEEKGMKLNKFKNTTVESVDYEADWLINIKFLLSVCKKLQ